MEYFSSPKSPYLLLSMSNSIFFPGVKRLACEAESWPPSTVHVKKIVTLLFPHMSPWFVN